MERSHHMPKYRLVFATDHHAGFFLRKHSIGHSPAEYSNAIKEGEGSLFVVTREPALTKKGKASRTMDYDDAKILVGIGTAEYRMRTAGFGRIPVSLTYSRLRVVRVVHKRR